MKQIYVWVVALLISTTSFSQAVVEMNPQLPINDPTGILGFANVFNLDGTFAFGSPWGVTDLNTEVDPVENTITLLPNYFIWTVVPQTDLFWFTPAGEANKIFSASTYQEDNSLVGAPFTFVGGVEEFTLDPAYEVIAFIRVFNADFSVLKEETTTLVAGENFSVTYDNVEPADTVIQFGFQVTGLIADPANAAALGSVVIGPSLNDECDNATPVACGDVVAGNTSFDTDSGGNPAPDEWFSFTGTGAPEFVTFSTCNNADFDTVLRVFDACGGTEIATNDDAAGCAGFTSEVSFLSDGTSTYYLMVDGFGTDSGSFNLTVSCESPEPNDLCDNAIAIACGETVSGSTSLASLDDDVAGDCGAATLTAPGVWYVYTDVDGLTNDIVLTTCDQADYDTKISVFSGDCTNLVCVDGNDDDAACSGFTSTVEFTSDGSSTYYILVHGFGAATGNFDLTMSCTIVPPDNDAIANAIDLDEVGCPFTDEGVQMPGATAEAGNPTDCDISGANGVWYKFTPVTGGGFITCTIANPTPFSSVTFYTAPDENASENDLVLVNWFENQCLPGDSARIPYALGQAYYVFVTNEGATTDIVFSECETLGSDDNTIEGFAFYPNPANSVVNLNSVNEIEAVAIYNVVGQKVMNVAVGATTSQLNVSNLAAGAYIMEVTVNGQVGTYKLIKN